MRRESHSTSDSRFGRPSVAVILVVIGIALGATWLAQFLFAPTVLVGSSAGIQTMVLALPATFVSMLVLAFGAVFVIVQQANQMLSPRSSLMLARDERLVALAITTVLLAISALLIGGGVPDSPAKPAHSLTAGVGTLAVAAAALVAGYTLVLPSLLRQYTTPELLVRRLLRSIDEALANGSPVEEDLASLLEAEALAVLRRDEGTFTRAVNGVAAQLRRLAEERSGPRGAARPFAMHLSDAAASVGSDAPGFQPDRLLEVMPSAARSCIRLHLDDAAGRLLQAMGRLGTRRIAVDDPADPVATAEGLARLEASAEVEGRTHVAAEALAVWAMSVSAAGRLGEQLRRRAESTQAYFGSKPPYESARGAVASARWGAMWPEVDAEVSLRALAPSAATGAPGNREDTQGE